MPQSKTITLQELANIFHQYNAISVHIYSPDGTSGAVLRFNSNACSFYKSNGVAKSILLTNKSSSFRVEGPTVNIAYDALPTPSYATFSVTAHGFTFYITVC